MSLLNHRLMEECEKLSQGQSFNNAEQRLTFEQAIVANGRRIDEIHKRVLKTDWINKVRAGNLDYLEICNLFRDPDSFTDPQRWLAKLQANPLYTANRQMQSVHDALFIDRQQGIKRFYFATNAARMDLPTEIIPPCRISLAAQESTGQSSPSFRSIETMSILPRQPGRRVDS